MNRLLLLFTSFLLVCLGAVVPPPVPGAQIERTILKQVTSEPFSEIKTDQRCGYGDSYVIDPHGQTVAAAGLYDETLMVYHLDLEKKYRNRHNLRSRKSAEQLLGILKEVVEE